MEHEELDLVFGMKVHTFLPSCILDLIFKLTKEPPDDIIHLIAWVIPKEATDYMYVHKKVWSSKHAWQWSTMETWKEHTLYKLKNKAHLEDMCKKNHIPISSGKIPKLIVENQDEEIPPTATLNSSNLHM